MAPQGGSGDPQDESAKHVLDEFGQKVHDEIVKNGGDDAKKYIEALKGKLSLATFSSGELASSNDTCYLVKEYYNKRVNADDPSGERNPCGNGKNAKNEHVKRFSDTLGGQCTDQQIEGNDRNNGGACAPYRRLYLCSHNLETINNTTSTASDTLLAEVCYAAKEEGDLIKTHYTPYQATYGDSQLCTVLARSFADIGDIVRGKDPFYGNTQESTQREKLDENLKTIFEKIHEGLDPKIKSNYNDAPYYYKLREDWWTANRATIWEAITCDAGSGKYFRRTCGDDSGTLSHASNKCRCGDDKKPDDQVPTYFDYVPQYLRWFEEWAEDFCRIKQLKLKKLEKECRGEGGKERYCSGNGFDCEKTIYKKGKLVISSECTKCSVWCRMYETWIDNQKKEFIKQVKKYGTEISGGGAGGKGRTRKRRSATTKVYDGYESKFYGILKTDYGDVDKFLQLLNKENECKDINEEKEKIDFSKKVKDHKNINNEGTFYHSEYCEVCPDCGVKLNSSGWEKKDTNRCTSKKRYKIKDGAQSNDINVLSFGDKRQDIEKKLKAFCNQINRGTTNNGGNASSGVGGNASSGDCGGNSDPSLCEPWKCYKHDYVEEVVQDEDDPVDPNYVKGAGGLCILENKNKKEEKEKKSENDPVEFQKTFNDFFYFWIRRFLNDSMYWRGKVERCLKNDKKTCGNQKCKDNCDCFLKWIGKKKTEWGKIVQHFNTQEGIPEGLTHDALLKTVLNIDELFQDIKDGYGNAKELKGIENMLKEEERKSKAEAAEADVVGGENNTTIDKLLQHEDKDAKGCQSKHNTCPPKPQDSAGGRSLIPPLAPEQQDEGDHSSGEEEEEEEEEEEKETEGEKEEKKEETATEVDKVKPATEEELPPKEEVDPKVCETVDKILTKDNNALQDACKQKYEKGREKFPNWKCIPSGEKSGGDKDGATCIPPRRRKLYLGGFKRLTDGTTEASSEPTSASTSSRAQSSSSSESPQGSTQAGTSSQAQDALLTAFVESAAVETFFLWHRYKKEKKPPATQDRGLLLLLAQEASQEVDPQKELEKGDIPEEFKRQMFYTLGDYRDILYSGSNDTSDTTRKQTPSSSNDNLKNIVLEASGNKEDMQKIQDKIKEHINSGSKAAGIAPKSSAQTPKDWWENNAKHIWNGMIYALTYNTDTASGTALQQIDDLKDKLWDSGKKQPKTNAGPKSNIDYTYEKVELKEENSETQAKSTSPGTSPSGEKTRLSEFVLRPPYFRYLEEWGQNFCKEKKKRLEKIKGECVKSDGGRRTNCSGDGEDCETMFRQNYEIFPDFECRTCGEECTKYKKWINTKKTQYEKQKDAYTGQKDKCKEENGGTEKNNGFCVTLETNYTEAKDFLGKLGSCKIENGVGKTIFDDDKTFKHTKDCDPCSQFKVKCERNGHCDTTKRDECKNKTYISANDIGKRPNSAEGINMLVSDNSTKEFEGHGLEACEHAGIFKGIRKVEWECGNVCGYNVCKPKNVNGKTFEGQANGENQIIFIRALFKRWLEYFLQDYNKIKHKISHCINKGNGSPCINRCVEQWISTKKKEWRKIKNHYKTQNEKGDDDIKTSVKNILSGLYPETELNKAIKPCKSLDKFETSCGLNSDKPSEKEGEDYDLVLCLIEKLEKEANKCKDQASGETCTDPQPKTPHLPDDEEENIEENQVKPPEICGDVLATTKPTEQADDKCGEIEEKTDEKKEQPEQNPDTESETKPKDDLTPPAPAPAAPPAADQPQADEPSKPIGDILSSTIPFGIAIALTSIVFLFLKVIHIVVYICIYICVDVYVCVGMFGCIYICVYVDVYVFSVYVCLSVWIYICVCTCMCFIYILYICIYIDKEKNEKKEKKKKEKRNIKKNLLK